MSPDPRLNNPTPRTPSPQQSAGDIGISGQENATAFVNAAGQATVDQSRHHTIINYYYREDIITPSVNTPAASDDLLSCPYRGLFHFGPDDAEFFFGREVVVTALAGAVERSAFIPLLGASGSGKSSVVLAGLVPHLQQAGHWQFTHFRPGEDPFYALALALVPLYTPTLDATARMVQTRQLARCLQAGELRLADVIATIQSHHPSDRILLIADQFEELYTLGIAESTRRQFLDCLLTSLPSGLPTDLAASKGSPLVMVATLRADFLGNALAYRPFADVLQQGDIKLAAMTSAELSQAIEKPAQTLGVEFEDGLVSRILNDVSDEPGNLPLLEFALTELWQHRANRRLTHTAYETIGEVKGALARHADAKYNALSAAEQDDARRIFLQLVHPGQGTEDTRRLATKAELGESRWPVVKQLADARLVVTSLDVTQQQETVEVVHEALIRSWGRLRQWMESDREFRVWQDQLRASMQQWKHAQQDEGALLRGGPLAEAEERLDNRPQDLSPAEQTFIQKSLDLRDRQVQTEKQRLKNLRSLLTLTSTVAAIAALAGLLAFRQSRVATTAKRAAENQEAVAISQYSQALYNLNGDKIDSLIEGIRAGVTLKQARTIDPDAQARVESALQEVVYGVSERNRLQGHFGGVQAVSFSGDGQLLASGGRDNSVKLWTANGQPLMTLAGHQDVVWSVSFSSDGQMLASGSRDRTARLWDIEGNELQVLEGHDGDVYSVSVSPDGQTIATASQDKTVKLWDRSGNLLQTLSGHQGPVNGVAFSPDGQTIASASSDRTVKLWDMNGKERRTLEGHTGSVQSLSFSPDGNELATASEDKTVKLWSLNRNNVRTLKGHAGAVWGVTYSPDGL
ncbi:MAG: WD40 repeat domain-containing protein, partial [Phormidesmis sp.]